MNPNKLNVTIYLLLNLASSLLIILLNKWIYVHVQFPNVTLSMLHFVMTFLGLFVCERFGLFNKKSVRLKEVLVLALSFCGFVVLTNLSLQKNTVGTFQVAKVLTTPGVILIQFLCYGKPFSFGVLFTLIPIIAGVICNFYYDLYFNELGTIYALLGVVITSVYQVLVNKKQSELQINSMQLLYYQAPLSALFLCTVIPFIEDPLDTIAHDWKPNELMMILVSCLAALACNLTTYWIIGNTSPLTYNMFGHLKFVIITLGGWMLFDTSGSANQWFGIGLTFFGVILYTHIKMRESEEVENKNSLEKIDVKS